MKLYPLPFSPACQKLIALAHGKGASFFALEVLEAKEGRIRVIDHFMSASSHAAFFAGGLARVL